jgi:uncharacterized membrane protein YdjX (TVP38/TMEM64 family)
MLPTSPTVRARGGSTRFVRFALAVKLAPGVPAFVKHYGMAMVGVPFPVYFALSMLITGAYAVGFVVVGGSLLDHRLSRTAIVIGALAAAIAVGMWWSRRRQTRERSLGEGAVLA